MILRLVLQLEVTFIILLISYVYVIFMFLSSVAYSFCLKGLNTAHQDFYILRKDVGHVVVIVVCENYMKKCLNYTRAHTHTHSHTCRPGKWVQPLEQ